MQPQKVIIGHSWIDVSLNIQTKAVAYKINETAKVWYLSQARLRNSLVPQTEGFTVLEWPHKRPTRLKDFLFAIRLVKHTKPDLIIAHFASTKALIFAGWLFNVPYRVAWYHTLYEQTKVEAASKWKAPFDVLVRTVTYKLATHLITQTQFASADAVVNQRVSKSKVYIIPNGMQVPVVKKPDYAYTMPQIVFLYIGRITYSKGCDKIIAVFAQLLKTYKHISLELFGNGDAYNGVEQLITRLGIGSKVVLKGSTKSYLEVYENLERAYALVVPSRTDNFPTVIIEAMACGVPVIGANAGGIPEMIDNGTDGFICDNEHDWVVQCEMLINNPALRNAMAANARATFEKKYAIEKHVSNVMQFINSLPSL